MAIAVEPWSQRLGRGAVAGLAGGAASASVFWLAVEPSISKAVDLENAAVEGHAHGDDGELISRTTQLIGGTVTSIVVGVLLGVVFAVVYAKSQHRLAGFTDLGRSLSLCALAFAVVALLPALKVPANPPAVGDPGTVNDRMLTYLVVILLGVVLVGASFAAARAARRRTERVELWWAAGIVVAVVGGALILYLAPSGIVDIPTIMPASLVWQFRIGSLGQHAGMWLGIALAHGALAHRRSPAHLPCDASATAAWAE